MFSLNNQSRQDASKQELQHQIKEVKAEASRLASQESVDQDKLAKFFKELERCYRTLADAESFPPLEESYRSKAAKWRQAADQKRVVDTSTLTENSPESGSGSTYQAEQSVNEAENASVDGESELYDWETPDLGFDDVGGRSNIIERLEELVIDPVENKEKHHEYGVPIPNGIVFEGPPGTGKSLLAKALAGELNRQFLDISLADIRGSLAGESEQNLQQLFQQAIDKQPCIINIDEVDAIVYDRTEASHSAEMRQLITQFLRDMPSFTDEEVLIVGSTNMKGDMDDAATRPGRFGHRFEIGMPDKECRREVLQINLEDRPVASSDVDCREIARDTACYSCADLEAIVIEASRSAMQEDSCISQSHLRQAVDNVAPSVDIEKW